MQLSTGLPTTCFQAQSKRLAARCICPAPLAPTPASEPLRTSTSCTAAGLQASTSSATSIVSREARRAGRRVQRGVLAAAANSEAQEQLTGIPSTAEGAWVGKDCFPFRHLVLPAHRTRKAHQIQFGVSKAIACVRNTFKRKPSSRRLLAHPHTHIQQAP
jgi:hypothetical protein